MEAPASHAREYLRKDLIENFLYALYSWSTMRVARQTLTTYEHRSMGRDRTFELTGSAAGYWTRNFIEMLCRRVGDELWLMQATPRRWLKDGERIEVKNLQTDFGPVSFSVCSNLASNSIEARVTAPNRHPARRIKVRFRVPGAPKMQSVTVNGATWHDFEADKEWVTIPGLPTENIIQIRY